MLLTPCQVSACLSRLDKYAELCRALRDFKKRGIKHPLHVRNRLKWFEENLATDVFQFINLLSKFPHLAQGRGWPILTCCPECNASLYLEWYPDFDETPCFITCAECDAVLYANLEGLK